MTVVRNFGELFDRQAAMDAEAQTLVAATIAAHPDEVLDLTNRPLKLMNAQDIGTCPDCGEAQFTVRDQATGRTIPMCRMCISAVRRQSLQHTQYGTEEICWNCEITVDSLGIISGATHHTKPVEDQLLPNGSTRLGIGPLLRAGRIDLTDGVLTII